MLRLFGDAKSGNCYKAQLLLHQLGFPYEWVPVNILNKESRIAEFLPESNAILHYLADGSAYLPLDKLQHAQVLQWMFFEQYLHEPSIASARFIVRYLGRPPEQEQRLQQKIADGYGALALMDQHLDARHFLVGECYSIADIALYAYTHVAHEGGFDLAPYRAVRAWLARVQSQPGYVGMDDQPPAAVRASV